MLLSTETTLFVATFSFFCVISAVEYTAVFVLTQLQALKT